MFDFDIEHACHIFPKHNEVLNAVSFSFYHEPPQGGVAKPQFSCGPP